jgi:predicted PurR-regulated permease PerM
VDGPAPKTTTSALVVLAVLAVVAALYLMKAILIPLVLAIVLACLLSPATHLLRRALPVGATGAAVLLFVLLAVVGLYLASLTAENLVQATYTLPSDVENLTGQISRRLNDTVRDHPYLSRLLPESGTINELGQTNRRLLLGSLSDRLADLTGWIAQGFIVLILVLFLLAESEMLTPKVIRFFAPAPGEALAAEQTLRDLTRKIREYLLARTLINLGLGVVVAAVLGAMKVKFPIALGAFAALTNFIPYVGQVIGGALPVLVTLAYSGGLGDAFIVAAVYLGLVGLEGYVVTPYVMGRSLDLNGTTVLVACLFWGFLWGLMGLILAMPITVSMKLVFQHVPALHRWADLMSRDWQPPAPAKAPAPKPRPIDAEGPDPRSSPPAEALNPEPSAPAAT